MMAPFNRPWAQLSHSFFFMQCHQLFQNVHEVAMHAASETREEKPTLASLLVEEGAATCDPKFH